MNTRKLTRNEKAQFLALLNDALLPADGLDSMRGLARAFARNVLQAIAGAITRKLVRDAIEKLPELQKWKRRRRKRKRRQRCRRGVSK